LTVYVLLRESSSFMILRLSVCCVLSGPFAKVGSQAYIHVLVVATLYAVCTSNLSDSTANTTVS